MLTTSSHVEHYLRNAFESYTADLMSNLLTDKSLFLDIGAHHGFYTLLAATKNKRSKVIAFEPVKESSEILKKNVELNKLKNVEVHNRAVSSQSGKRAFRVADWCSNSSFYDHPLSKTVRTIEVSTIAVDDFLKRIPRTRTVVKIAAEGHEMSILTGMRHLLTIKKDITLFVEFNPDCLRNAGIKPEDLLRRIDQLGFDIYMIDDERREIYKLAEASLSNWESYFGDGNFGKNYFNLLCVRKERSLNVCFFSHSSLLEGAERSLLELVAELVRDQGAVCSVVMPKDGPLREKLEAVGASLLVVDYSWWCDFISTTAQDIDARLNRSFRNVVNETRRRLRKLNPDIIVTNTIVIPWGAIAAHFLNRPHVWYVREFGIMDYGLEFYQPFEFTLDFVKNSSNLILTNSNAVKTTLFGDSPTEQVQTVYTHVDVPSNAHSKDKNRDFQRTKATRLLIAGHVTESKGQLDAVLAVGELLRRKRDVELIVMGVTEGDYFQRLQKIVEEENLQPYVKCLGFKENPYSVLGQADIVLVCSRMEAFGRVTLESMTLKKPVVGTNTGGTPELIREGFNGLLYTPGDYVALADRIEYLIRHREKMRQFGKNGYGFAKKNFTRKRYGGRVCALFKGLKGKANALSSSRSSFLTRLVDGTIAELEAEHQSLEAEHQSLEAEHQSLEAEHQSLEAEHQSLEAEKASQAQNLILTSTELTNTHAELAEIKESLGYRFMRFYGSRIDRLLHDGARRGKFKKRPRSLQDQTD